MRSRLSTMVAGALLAAAAPAAAQEAGGEPGVYQDRRFDAEHFHAVDLDHLRYTVYPKMSAVSTTSASLANLQGTLHEADARLVYPSVFDHGKTTLAVGVEYTFTYYQLDGVRKSTQPTSSANEQVVADAVPTMLHAPRLVFGLNQRLVPHWSVNVGGSVGMYSDLRTFDLGAVALQGKATFTYSRSSAFSIGLGLAYQSKFGQALLLPALTVDWYLGAGFRLRVAAPEEAHLYFIPHDRIVFQIGGSVSGGNYRVHPDAMLVTKDPTTGTVQSQVPVTYAYDLAYSTIAVDAGVKLRLGDGLYLALTAPLALKRRWEGQNLCWTSGNGQQQCFLGPASVDLANVKNLSLGGQAALEYRY